MVIEQTEEQKQIAQDQIDENQKSLENLNEQKKKNKETIQKKVAAEAQAKLDQVNQELSEAPKKIEDELDNFNKTLKTIMGKNVSPKVDINSPEYDTNVAMADFNAILNPVLGVISPIESVVGKIPVLGDISGLISKMTSSGDTGGLTMEDIKKLVPTLPEIPPSLKSKVTETKTTIQEFCSYLQMIMIKVIFQMLKAISDMFDQIAGVIGVPRTKIFPFNLISQMPVAADKIQDFATNAPSQVTTIVEGKMRQQFAAAQALSVPKPAPVDMKAVEELNKAKEEQPEETKTQEPSIPPPEEPPVTPSPPVEIEESPIRTIRQQWVDVEFKWSEIFAKHQVKKAVTSRSVDIEEVVEGYKAVFCDKQNDGVLSDRERKNGVPLAIQIPLKERDDSSTKPKANGLITPELKGPEDFDKYMQTQFDNFSQIKEFTIYSVESTEDILTEEWYKYENCVLQNTIRITYTP